jgi:hypothetical protein
LTVPEELARAVFDQLGPEHNRDLIPELALAISRELGAVRDPNSNWVYLVLGPFSEALPAEHKDFLPVFIATQLPNKRASRTTWSTRHISWLFLTVARNPRPRPRGYCHWAVVRSDYQDWLPLYGNQPKTSWKAVDAERPDIEYEWFDLNKVALGGIIYRINNRGELRLFQRLTEGPEGRWARLFANARADSVDIRSIVQQVTGDDPSKLRLDRLPGGIRAIRPLPVWPGGRHRPPRRRRSSAPLSNPAA